MSCARAQLFWVYVYFAFVFNTHLLIMHSLVLYFFHKFFIFTTAEVVGYQQHLRRFDASAQQPHICGHSVALADRTTSSEPTTQHEALMARRAAVGGTV